MSARLLPGLAVLALVVLGAFGAWATHAGTAWASCAADPPRSPRAFVGVVTATSSQARVATVRTNAGATVTVVGTPATGPGAGSGVDRTFEVGGRYEFHPINDASPFEDNACTATRLLSSGASPAESAPSASPSASPASDASGRNGLAKVVFGIAVIAAAVMVAARSQRARRGGG